MSDFALPPHRQPQSRREPRAPSLSGESFNGDHQRSNRAQPLEGVLAATFRFGCSETEGARDGLTRFCAIVLKELSNHPETIEAAENLLKAAHRVAPHLELSSLQSVMMLISRCKQRKNSCYVDP